MSEEKVDPLMLHYGRTDDYFREYLRTLGLRTFEGAGTDVEAFLESRDEVSKRGW